MSSEQCVDNGEICRNCAEIITEALQDFILSPLAEGYRMDLDMLRGKKQWKTRGNISRVLSENQSSRFGTSPLECYVCFRSSELIQTAGAKQVTLMCDIEWAAMFMNIVDEARSKSVEFILTLRDGRSTFTHTTRLVIDDIRRRNIRR